MSASDPGTNTYLVASSALIECHDCSCHISPPCSECVDCKVCNPCWTCDEIHDAPRDENCPTRATTSETRP